MGIHTFTKIDQKGEKPLDEKKRKRIYQDIYTTLRKLKLGYIVASNITENVIDNINLKFNLGDSIKDVNTFWYRCKECNKVLRIDKQKDTRFCSSRSCSLYHIHFDKEGNKYAKREN